MCTTLAHRFGVSTKTIDKWKSRDFVKDKTSRPKTICGQFLIDIVHLLLAASMAKNTTLKAELS
jgi:uncharacterized protein YjcR